MLHWKSIKLHLAESSFWCYSRRGHIACKCRQCLVVVFWCVIVLTNVICYLDESEPLTLIRSANIISEYIRRFDSYVIFIIRWESSNKNSIVLVRSDKLYIAYVLWNFTLVIWINYNEIPQPYNKQFKEYGFQSGICSLHLKSQWGALWPYMPFIVPLPHMHSY